MLSKQIPDVEGNILRYKRKRVKHLDNRKISSNFALAFCGIASFCYVLHLKIKTKTT